jgi:hypothetical protein
MSGSTDEEGQVARVVAVIRRRFPEFGLVRPCQIGSALRGRSRTEYCAGRPRSACARSANVLGERMRVEQAAKSKPSRGWLGAWRARAELPR